MNEQADTTILNAVRHWLEHAVIGLNLCPFAKAVHVKKQIRTVISHATTASALEQDLAAELQRLASTDPDLLDTTLLVHPYVLTDFLDYNAFLGVADRTLKRLHLSGILQIASFHPQYQFADSAIDAIENYTNRAPYPMLHLLREDSVSRATQAFPDAAQIFDRNIETMRQLDPAHLADYGFAASCPLPPKTPSKSHE